MARPKKQATEIELDLVSEQQNEQATEIELLNEKLVYNVEVIKDSQHLKAGNSYKVSGNVANVLLKKGLIKII